ncbi:hypothetical protein, partial [Kocuria carniphila]
RGCDVRSASFRTSHPRPHNEVPSVKRRALFKLKPATVSNLRSRCLMMIVFVIAAVILKNPIIWIILAVLIVVVVLQAVDALREETGWPSYEGWPHIETDPDTGEEFFVDAFGVREPLDPNDLRPDEPTASDH